MLRDTFPLVFSCFATHSVITFPMLRRTQEQAGMPHAAAPPPKSGTFLATATASYAVLPVCFSVQINEQHLSRREQLGDW